MTKRLSTKMFAILIAAAMVFTAFSFISQPAKAATPSKYKTYTISAKSGPINKKMRRYSFYNRYTKHYYVLRSYMELFEKRGGGTLILKKEHTRLPIQFSFQTMLLSS